MARQDCAQRRSAGRTSVVAMGDARREGELVYPLHARGEQSTITRSSYGQSKRRAC